MPYAVPQGNTQLLQQKKYTNGSPKMAPQSNKQMKTNSRKTANGMHAGDVVSDEESGNEGEESDDNANNDKDSDEEDEFALSGARRTGGHPTSRLAGPAMKDIDMEDDATAGAEDDDEDDDAYGGIEDVSDDESGNEAGEDSILRLAEDDLRKEYERLEEPSRAMTSNISNMSLTGDRQSAPAGNDLEDLDLDFSADPFGGLPQNDRLYQEMLADATNGYNADATDIFAEDNTMSMWRNLDTDFGDGQTATNATTQKKVRFEDTASSRASSMSSEDDDREDYPDLFDHDDPASRQRALTSSMNFDVIQDESEFEYELEDEDEKMAFEIDAQEDSESEMSEDCMHDVHMVILTFANLCESR